jgi:excisionase family DNA binding protein
MNAGSDGSLATDEVAQLLGVPVAGLYTLRAQGVAPPGFRVGRRFRYGRREVERWLAEKNGRRLAVCGGKCGGIYSRSTFRKVPG